MFKYKYILILNVRELKQEKLMHQGVTCQQWWWNKPEDMIFYNCDFMKQYRNALNNNKNTVPGHGYFAN